MQSTMKASLLLLLAAPVALADHYGPHQCVSVERSDHGSCVFKTACKGIDTSKFEFAFSCADKDGGRTKHSFGVGGFDDEEEYDTEVKCSFCHAPVSEAPVVEKTASETAVAFSAAKEPTKKEQFQTATFGPDKCVSTYKSETGTCIVKTQCKEHSLKEEQMGIVCGDAKGDMVRHVFGKDSFEHKETFDTLIPCTQCLAMDNFDAGTDTEEQVLKDEVDTLKKEVLQIKADQKKDVADLSKRVSALEGAGGEKAEEKAEKKAEEPKAEEAKAEEAEEPKKALMHTSHRRHAKALRGGHHAAKKHHMRRQAKKHHRRQEDDQEDDDEQDQQDQDEAQEQSADSDDEDQQQDQAHDQDDQAQDEQSDDDNVDPDDM